MHSPAAGAGPSYSGARASDVGIEHPQQRPVASPHSTTSSATSLGRAYAPTMTTNAYTPQSMGSSVLGLGPSAAPPDLRLTLPVSGVSQSTSWHPHYSTDLSGPGNWNFGGGYPSASPATGLPSSAQTIQYTPRFPSLTNQPAMPVEARFVPLQTYEGQGQQTSHQ